MVATNFYIQLSEKRNFSKSSSDFRKILILGFRKYVVKFRPENF
jgi:hypothetical protein